MVWVMTFGFVDKWRLHGNLARFQPSSCHHSQIHHRKLFRGDFFYAFTFLRLWFSSSKVKCTNECFQRWKGGRKVLKTGGGLEAMFYSGSIRASLDEVRRQRLGKETELSWKFNEKSFSWKIRKLFLRAANVKRPDYVHHLQISPAIYKFCYFAFCAKRKKLRKEVLN